MLLPICGGLAANLQTASAAPFDVYVTEAATRMQIPQSWITAVMRAESTGDASAVSPKGAMGLMQIMPDTWRELRAALNLGSDPYNPRDNITAGAAYLRWLHDRYGDAGFLAAYNAGPGRYEELLRTRRTFPDETRKYVTRVTTLLRGKSLGDPVFDADFVDRPHAEILSGSRLFVGPFVSRTVAQDTPEMMSIFVQVMRSEAPSRGLFVSVSQRSAP
ncbi:lytic transglycosylase domain-containing protein [Acidomonas methanolica]|uniref:lytic transglycosylase domain-containing protein n=1 Tax=Acidomonas methanolica TaxID=437 RepID=UPI00164B3E88|nr:lytic transglycosylase domain-containing protein [Acidomonas methanolica]MBU2655549.1 lytic transglycosylase domain-containing protein [Acidomonas methanolica]